MPRFIRKDKPLRSVICTGLCLSALFLGACGIKPGDLQPPTGQQDTAFPRTYPAGAQNQ